MTLLRSTTSATLLSDVCAMLGSLILAVSIRSLFEGEVPVLLYVKFAPLLLLFLPLYSAVGLYPGLLRPPSEELKYLSFSSSVGFLFISFFLFMGQQGAAYSRAIMLMCWVFVLFMVPFARYCTRRYCSRYAWWGYAVVLFAPDEQAGKLSEQLYAHREKGLIVVAVVPLDFEKGDSQEDDDGADRLRVNGNSADMKRLLERLQKKYPGALAYIAADSLSRDRQENVVPLLSRYFRRVIVHVGTDWLKQSSLRVADAPGGYALTLRQNLLDPARMRIKRFLDIGLCLLGSVFLLLLIPFLAVCIRLDSRGPVFFQQTRVGQNGRPIRIYKFRTMVVDAEKVLDDVLHDNEDLRKEWESTQKLMQDPRLTRVGAFLRRTSLDELPQIFNVIKGEMSLVGPRPIVVSEIARYSEAYDLYVRVKPGMTGLWQISGRNDVDYGRRVALDQHYIYNWSVWLDIYIIICTIPVLFTRRGAY